MGSMQISQLKIRKSAFINATNLVTYMNNYMYNVDEKDIETLDFFAEFSEGVPLPSGRWGNAIALALEINNYVAAEYLIENADRLKLDTDTVVSELGGKSAWSLKDEYLYSQLTYEGTIIPKREGQADDDYQKFVNSIVRNKLANERLEKRLSITSEDKKILNKQK